MKLKLSTAQIGRSGELLVQSQLLLLGVESAPLTTDTGIDLVAYYSPAKKRPVTIQVKSQLVPTPSGGRGKLSFDWEIPKTCPAELVTLVDLSESRIWLMQTAKFGELAHERGGPNLRLHMYADKTAKPHSDGLHFVDDFAEHLLEKVASRLLGT